MSISDPSGRTTCELAGLTACERIRAHLGMKHGAVGVRFIFDEQELESQALPARPDKPMWYCQMVLQAAGGKQFTARMQDMSCPNSELSLGFRKPRFVNIKTGFDKETQAVVIGPLENADVVLLVLNNRQAMTMSILMGGISAEFRGEVAVCGEATAQVYHEGLPNLSFLCNGARMFGGYKDSEVVLGLPPIAAEKVAERIMALQKAGGALCGCVVSDLPREIIENFKTIGFEKGSDYFFGKLCGWSVRIYLDKDDTGRIKNITLYVLEKAPLDGVLVKPPFSTREREGWVDIVATFDTQSIGADLYSGGDKLRNTFTELICNYIIRTQEGASQK